MGGCEGRIKGGERVWVSGGALWEGEPRGTVIGRWVGCDRRGGGVMMGGG